MSLMLKVQENDKRARIFKEQIIWKKNIQTKQIKAKDHCKLQTTSAKPTSKLEKKWKYVQGRKEN